MVVRSGQPDLPDAQLGSLRFVVAVVGSLGEVMALPRPLLAASGICHWVPKLAAAIRAAVASALSGAVRTDWAGLLLPRDERRRAWDAEREEREDKLAATVARRRRVRDAMVCARERVGAGEPGVCGGEVPEVVVAGAVLTALLSAPHRTFSPPTSAHHRSLAALSPNPHCRLPSPCRPVQPSAGATMAEREQWQDSFDAAGPSQSRRHVSSAASSPPPRHARRGRMRMSDCA